MNSIDPLTHTVLRPVNGTTRASTIATRLRDAMILGIYPDGCQIPSESSLTRIFDAAPMTIRDALTTLRSEGLIVTRRGRSGGSFVSDTAGATLATVPEDATLLGASEIAQHTGALTGHAAALAAERATAADIRELFSHLERYDDAVDSGRCPLICAQAASQIAIELARVSQSPRLTREIIAAQVEWLPWAAEVLTAGTAAAAPLHSLADAVSTGDRNAAREAVDHYLTAQLQALTVVTAQQVRDGLAGTVGTDSTDGTPAEQAARRLADLLTDAREAVTALALAHAVPDPRYGDSLATASTTCLNSSPSLSGVGFASSPESGQEVVGWFIRGDGIRRRALELSASAPGDVGYRGFEWYTLPASAGHSTVVGPYVDDLCGDDYTLTISVPAVHDGIFAGVFVGDLSVATMERNVLPILATSPEPLALVHTDGRVAVSTDPSAPAGALLAEVDYTVLATAEPFPYRVVSRG